MLVATVAFGMRVDRPMWAWCCTWSSRRAPRVICRNQAEPAVMASRRRCCCFIPMAIAAAAWAVRQGRDGAASQLRRMESVAEGPDCRHRPCCWQWVRWRNPAVVVIAAKPVVIQGQQLAQLCCALQQAEEGLEAADLAADLADDAHPAPLWRWALRRWWKRSW